MAFARKVNFTFDDSSLDSVERVKERTGAQASVIKVHTSDGEREILILAPSHFASAGVIDVQRGRVSKPS
jgi:hypothetical protein